MKRLTLLGAIMAYPKKQPDIFVSNNSEAHIFIELESLLGLMEYVERECDNVVVAYEEVAMLANHTIVPTGLFVIREVQCRAF